MSFIINILLLCVSVFMLAVSLRYGLMGVTRLDDYFSQKNNSSYPGFQWYYRIPFSFGVIPEYYYAIILGHDNYFKRNWWALKTASFISVLIFIAGLKSRSAVSSYFSFSFLQDKGIFGLVTSGNFVNFMNIIVLLYVALFILISIESFRMHGIYAPIRIAAYGILSLFMANLTIITLSIIVFIAVIYLIYKVVKFLFFSSRKNKRYVEDEKEDETAASILGGGMREFKTELYQWEDEQKDNPTTSFKSKTSETKKRKRPKITRRRKRKIVSNDDEVPRLRPD
ncbi:MAG: hypothetical protein QM503_12690 [Bacteroidota bacterium]